MVIRRQEFSPAHITSTVESAKAGARLSQYLHVSVSPDTMLRLLYRMELTPAVGLRVVGIDEWAWRKGLRYRSPDRVQAPQCT